VRGDTVEIFPANYGDTAIRVEFFGDEVDRMVSFDSETQRSIDVCDELSLIPAREVLWNADAAKKIKAEIERLYKEYRLGSSIEAKYRCEAYRELLGFINSMQKESECEDLELASERYSCKFSSSKYGHDKVKDAVVWGANWQKERMMTALLDMEKDSVEVERKYGEGGRELYLKMLGVLRPFEED
jgi:transcription-repair coupling factor (superfamily II helicase)